MKTNPKPCKGINSKTKGFGCGKKCFDRVYGLGISCGCYALWLLNTEEGKNKLNKSTLKATKHRVDLKKTQNRIEKRKTIVKHLRKTKEIVHKMIRLRDKYKPCISCGIQWKDDFDAGHFFSANNYRSIKFNFDNIHGQCIRCNRMNSGNHEDYSLKLPYRIGEDRFLELVNLAREDKKFTKNWEVEELIQIQEKAKQIIKNLQK